MDHALPGLTRQYQPYHRSYDWARRFDRTASPPSAATATLECRGVTTLHDLDREYFTGLVQQPAARTDAAIARFLDVVRQDDPALPTPWSSSPPGPRRELGEKGRTHHTVPWATGSSTSVVHVGAQLASGQSCDAMTEHVDLVPTAARGPRRDPPPRRRGRLGPRSTDGEARRSMRRTRRLLRVGDYRSGADAPLPSGAGTARSLGPVPGESISNRVDGRRHLLSGLRRAAPRAAPPFDPRAPERSGNDVPGAALRARTRVSPCRPSLVLGLEREPGVRSASTPRRPVGLGGEAGCGPGADHHGRSGPRPTLPIPWRVPPSSTYS